MSSEDDKFFVYFLLGIGAIALLGYGGYKFMRSATGEDEREAALESIVMEVDEMTGFETSITENDREPTESESAIIDTMLRLLETKEYNAQSQGWLGDVGEALSDYANKYDIVLYIVAGLISIQIFRGVWKKLRGGGSGTPPSFKCLGCDAEFSTQYELNRHREQVHPVQINLANITIAQEAFSQCNAWEQKYAAVSSGVYMGIADPWTYQTEVFLAQLCDAMNEQYSYGAVTSSTIGYLQTTFNYLTLFAAA